MPLKLSAASEALKADLLAAMAKHLGESSASPSSASSEPRTPDAEASKPPPCDERCTKAVRAMCAAVRACVAPAAERADAVVSALLADVHTTTRLIAGADKGWLAELLGRELTGPARDSDARLHVATRLWLTTQEFTLPRELLVPAARMPVTIDTLQAALKWGVGLQELTTALLPPLQSIVGVGATPMELLDALLCKRALAAFEPGGGVSADTGAELALLHDAMRGDILRIAGAQTGERLRHHAACEAVGLASTALRCAINESQRPARAKGSAAIAAVPTRALLTELLEELPHAMLTTRRAVRMLLADAQLETSLPVEGLHAIAEATASSGGSVAASATAAAAGDGGSGLFSSMCCAPCPTCRMPCSLPREHAWSASPLDRLHDTRHGPRFLGSSAGDMRTCAECFSESVAARDACATTEAAAKALADAEAAAKRLAGEISAKRPAASAASPATTNVGEVDAWDASLASANSRAARAEALKKEAEQAAQEATSKLASAPLLPDLPSIPFAEFPRVYATWAEPRAHAGSLGDAARLAVLGVILQHGATTDNRTERIKRVWCRAWQATPDSRDVARALECLRAKYNFAGIV